MKRLIALVIMMFVANSAVLAQNPLFDPIQFKDPALKAAIEDELGFNDPNPGSILFLYHLDASGKDISDLTGLEYATNLEELNLYDNQISDLSPLSGLTNLKLLDVGNNRITDLSPLAGLTNLDACGFKCNSLNLEAYEVYIPQLEANGPSVVLYICSWTPIIVTLHATGVDSTSATLIAQVIDFGGEAWTVKFAYRTYLEGPYALAPNYTDTVSGKRNGDFIATTIDYLVLPDTTYEFWAIAENATGTYEGAKLKFTTLPGEPVPEVIVPDVVGMSKNDADSELASVAFHVAHTYEYSDTVPEGYVISQTPVGGTMRPEGSTVQLFISRGPIEPGPVVVPDVVGMSETDADSEITSAGLEVSYTYQYSDTVPEGYVISQSPSAGSSVAVGSYVLLTISKYDDVENGPSGLTIPLLVDGDFDASFDSPDLRADLIDQDWYESRQNVQTLVTLDSSNVGGNATKKAKLTASTAGSAYLTQEFSAPQTQQFAAQWDIYVDSILDRPGSSYDRAAWVFIGDDTGTTPDRIGPNAEDSERFVYLGFYKAGGGISGPMDLVARQSSETTTTFVTVATGLFLKQWYTITVFCDLTQDNYDVYIDGQFQMNVKARTPKSSVTHISFAEWSQNLGASTFYVDNVTAEADMIPACGPFLVDGDFDASSDGKALCANSADQDWYESRQDDSTLVTLDSSNVGGNATKKAKLTASTDDDNAYLTQEFSAPMTQQFAVQWDIYVDSILDRPGSSYDRAAWAFIGDDTGTTPDRIGPNAEDSERFVYLGFYKARGGISGPMDLVARQKSETGTTFITVATGLSLKQWYTITVICDLVQDTYDVYIDGQFQMTVKARTPKNSVTHISFAEWPQDEGAAIFYVDNVTAECVAE